MTSDYEKVLLGAWLNGQHLSDIKRIDLSTFGEREIAEQLLEGKSGLDIGIATGRLNEFSDAMRLHSDILYQTALKGVLKRQIQRSIANMDDLDMVRDQIDYYNGIGDVVEETKEPALLVANEIENRRCAKTVKWDKLPSLNYLTGGIRRDELTTIAARPAVGKSAFGLQIAMGVQAAGEKVLYFPLEMSATNTFLRVLINKGYIDSKEAKTGKPQNNDNLLMGLDYIDRVYKSRNFQVYEAQSSIEKIESAIKKEKPYLVVIDQLTQMRANMRFGSVRERFSYMTSTLKAISLREHVAILLLCQLNRTAADSPPTMAQLKESGSIEEDSGNIILLHNLTADQVNNPESIDWKSERPMLCTLAKQREGETGEFVMMFKPSRFAFFERSTR